MDFPMVLVGEPRSRCCRDQEKKQEGRDKRVLHILQLKESIICTQEVDNLKCFDELLVVSNSCH